ncbi:MAG: MerR family DNA-binding transcriptional regulator [Oscillospiraceae bacterium]|jgi:DNA-binding transcriptional MerR regulator|nr:MerR family DNA-binding transcriptional regulator [Oscillospiraceae bacterium]
MDYNTLLTIGEFSEATGIPVTTLIYYDNKGLLHPVQRGRNKYRYYSYYQTITVKLIHVLKNCHVPLNIIKAVMQKRTPETLLELLMQQEQEIPKKQKNLLEAQKLIHIFTDHICKGLSAESDQVSAGYLPRSAFSLGALNDFTSEDSFYAAYHRYCRNTSAGSGNLSYPVGGWWSDMESFLQNPVRPERFFSVDPDGKQVKPSGRYLVGYTQCFYGEINDLPERMVAYAKEHSLRFTGPMFNVFLLDEVSTVDPNHYMLQASIQCG